MHHRRIGRDIGAASVAREARLRGMKGVSAWHAAGISGASYRIKRIDEYVRSGGRLIEGRKLRKHREGPRLDAVAPR